MRKLPKLYILAGIFVIVFGTWVEFNRASPPPGAPGDVTISFTIPAAKVADFSAGFLAKAPIPQIQNPADPDGPYIDEYTPKQWIKEWLKRDAMKVYRHGKILLAQQTAIIDPNALE